MSGKDFARSVVCSVHTNQIEEYLAKVDALPDKLIDAKVAAPVCCSGLLCKCGAAQRSACVVPGATQCIFTSIHMPLSMTLSVCMHVYLSVCEYVYGLYVYMYVYSCT